MACSGNTDQLILMKSLRSDQSCLHECKQGLASLKPIIYEFDIQTHQTALSKRLSHLKIPMAAQLVWQT